MPLFLYKCPKCEEIVERFLTSGKDKEILCERCNEVCERQLSLHGNRTQLDSKSLYNDKILPDVKRIGEEIKKENDSVISDIFGENQ